MNWTKFNQVLFSTMDTMWAKELEKEDRVIDFPTDEITLMHLRKEVDNRGSWGWYVWSGNDIPRDNKSSPTLLPTTRPVKMNKKPVGKDAIYQKWRAKYNNDNLMYSEDGKKKRSVARQKAATTRRLLHTERNLETGYTVNLFGTLVGIADKKSISQESRTEHSQMVSRMKDLGTNTKKECTLTLLRLWEVTYACYNGISQEELKEKYLEDKLTIVSHYYYYETYAKKICQLENNADEKLYLHLCQLGSVMKKIFDLAGRKTDCYEFANESSFYNQVPAIATMIQISAFFKESPRIFLQLDNVDVSNRDDILNEVWSNGLCNVIFEVTKLKRQTEKRYGVASQGVPFIQELTEQQAVFVFATSPDVFGYSPDRDRKVKADRINSLIEFLRRCCLGIADKTRMEAMNEIKGLAYFWVATTKGQGRTELDPVRAKQAATEGLMELSQQKREAKQLKNSGAALASTSSGQYEMLM